MLILWETWSNQIATEYFIVNHFFFLFLYHLRKLENHDYVFKCVHKCQFRHQSLCQSSFFFFFLYNYGSSPIHVFIWLGLNICKDTHNCVHKIKKDKYKIALVFMLCKKLSDWRPHVPLLQFPWQILYLCKLCFTLGTEGTKLTVYYRRKTCRQYAQYDGFTLYIVSRP